jgi:hypothetical protein
MGNYKEETGKTRVGAFLQNVAPELLSVAGNLTGIGALQKLGEAIDGTDKLSEKQKLDAKLLLERDKMEAEQITQRHANDMASDSWLSKNIRPLTLAFTLLLLAVLMLTDSASTKFNVDEAYITLLKSLSLLEIAFYFGGRDLQKFTLNKSKSKLKS